MLAKVARPALPGSLQRDIRRGKTLRSRGRTDDRSGAGSGGLLPGWKEATAPDGKKYYFNAESGETRWEKPVDQSGEAKPKVSDPVTPPQCFPAFGPRKGHGLCPRHLHASYANVAVSCPRRLVTPHSFQVPSTAVAVRVKPVIPGVPGNVGKLPGGWRLITGQDGKPYYFNKKTGETSWDPPPPSADGDDGKPPPRAHSSAQRVHGPPSATLFSPSA